MSKSKINLNELLKDIDKAFELIKDIEGIIVDLKHTENDIWENIYAHSFH